MGRSFKPPMIRFASFNPFAFLRSSVRGSCLGVDIGTTALKMIEVRSGGTLPRLVNYAVLEAGAYLGRSTSALQTSSLKLFEQETIELVKVAVKQMNTRTTNVVASLPVFSAFITALNFPDMKPDELAKAITFQAPQYVPLPLADVALDWLKVGEYEDEHGYKQQQVLLISVPREHIEKYQRMFKAAGLNLRVLEVESLSVTRSAIGTDPTPTVIIDIGSRSTNIAFVERGKLRMNAQSDFAGATLTEALATSLNINPKRAEELKREKGIAGVGAEYELSTLMLPYLDVILNEVKKAYANYQTQLPTAPKMERAVLVGGGANLKGIDKYFSKELGMPAVKATPLVKYEYPPSLEAVAGEVGPVLGVALGLGLREFV